MAEPDHRRRPPCSAIVTRNIFIPSFCSDAQMNAQMNGKKCKVCERLIGWCAKDGAKIDFPFFFGTCGFSPISKVAEVLGLLEGLSGVFGI